MINRCGPLGLIAALLVSGVTHGAETLAWTARPSQEQPTTIERSDEQQARTWGLSSDEWTRYRELMRGPLGIYSPNLDPLTALGIEARSDEEQRRYAELQVQAEARRIEKLLAYQRAYDAAWQRLHPDMPRVVLPDTGAAFLPAIPATGERLAVFVKDACTACDHTVQRLQAAGVGFDLYLVGSHNDDALIRTWARRISIDPAKVSNRTITLNHDAGRWLLLGLPGELPAVLRKVNGQWQRQ
ncbi:TIGR03759 family integrating conjugative element protein [Pseudomonas sp. MOB-449]|nr:TIGR03759 family integrating conjugative element protein [Pseudomonas sp. MOB-449]